MAKKVKCDRKVFLSRAELGQSPKAERKLFGVSKHRHFHPDEYHEVYDDNGYVTIVRVPKDKADGEPVEE